MKFKLPAIGDYPAAYKPEIHGSYFPGRYYGKPDTPFGEVKLAELPAWIKRRDKSVRGSVSLFSRWLWRWGLKYQGSKCYTGSGIFTLQLVVLGMIPYYGLQYFKYAVHKQAKYH